MLQAAFWGFIAGSSLMIGAILGLFLKLPKKIIAISMAFGTGALIGAASFELLGDALENGGITLTAIFFLAGALTFTIGDIIVIRFGGMERKRSKESKTTNTNTGLAIFIGTILDAIPESIIIGAIIANENAISIVLIVSIFISNFPEGLSSSVGLKKDQYSNKKIILLWLSVLALSTIASTCGFILLGGHSLKMLAAFSSFAAGAIISMVSSTMLPEAYEEGGPIVGLIASAGLIVALVLTTL
jgi:zinc transporter, ZIP family